MVVRAWGKVEGTDVEFHKTEEEGVWSVDVPAPSGDSMVIEIWAIDEAGNVGYLATIRMMFDASCMKVKIIVTDYGDMFSMEEVNRMFGISEYSSTAKVESEYKTDIAENDEVLFKASISEMSFSFRMMHLCEEQKGVD